LKKDDFDMNMLMEVGEICICNKYIAKSPCDESLFKGIVGKESQRKLEFVPVICETSNCRGSI
jgi:hypothetical protein